MPTLLTIDQLSESQRQRGLIGLLIGTFFSWGGFFMVVPLMAVHFVDHLGWAAGSIGIILAVRQFTQQGFTSIFGVVADRIGPRILIISGMLLRAVGFAWLGYADTWAIVFASSMVVAIGGSMFEAPISASVAALTYPEERRRFFAKSGMISGIGTAVGTQIGAVLIGQDFTLVCLGGAIAFILVGVIAAVMLPPIAVSLETEGSAAGVKRVLKDSLFLRYVAIVSGYWFAWVQFGLTITLAAVAITGSDRAVSWIYLVNAGITVGLGYLLPRLLERWLQPLQQQILGTFTIGVGLLMVGFATDFAGVILAVALFAIGAVITRPGQEAVMANLADPRARGTYFGVAMLALAVGGGLGNYLGGVIYDLGGDGTSPVPWIVFSAVTFSTALLLWLNRKRFGVVRS